MEHQLWKCILALLGTIDKPRRRTRQAFSCEEIVRVWFWAVLHDRPVSWATRRFNWPLHERRRKLPSSSTMSRRLRGAEVQALLAALERAACRTDGKPLVWIVDGKSLTVSGVSKDKQAGYGRVARGKAKGYKLHLIQGIDGSLAAWRIAPMNKDERVMARRMVRDTSIQGYLLADGNYDSNPLHEVCRQRGNLQLVAPLRGGKNRPKRRKKQDPSRRRALELLETTPGIFGRELHQPRNAIERSFGNLTNWGGGLTHLPPWVRTYHRVRRWVQAKLVCQAIKRLANKTYGTA